MSDNSLDRVLCQFSNVDWWTARDACEGTLITGSPGAGKSSTSGKTLALALLQAGCGGLVLTAKSEETRNWIEYARLAHRSQDLIVVSADSGHCFDPLFYEWNRPGRGAGDVESIIDLFTTLLTLGKPQGEGAGKDPFWERATEQLIRNVLILLSIAGEPISIASIHEFVQSLPSRPDELEEEAFRQRSYCAAVIEQIEQRASALPEEKRWDFNNAKRFVSRKWTTFDERPRSSVEMTWAGMADKFMFDPLRRLFSGGKITFTPEHVTHLNKIVIVDFPMLEYGQETGRLVNVLIKLAFQRAFLRRNFREVPNLSFLWQDEFQYFVTRRDNFFQQTCRGAGVAVVCLSQNILNLSEELGETQPGSRTKSFCGNLMLKIFHQQNDVETCLYAADLIGKEYRYLENVSSGESGSSISLHKQLVHNLDPIEFSRLQKPDDDCAISGAYIYQGGKTFSNGCNYLHVEFSR
ncbi:MAG: type IV secretory system conjugative DNA transfer family protein [Vicinamibacterales bacterium]